MYVHPITGLGKAAAETIGTHASQQAGAFARLVAYSQLQGQHIVETPAIAHGPCATNIGYGQVKPTAYRGRDPIEQLPSHTLDLHFPDNAAEPRHRAIEGADFFAPVHVHAPEQDVVLVRKADAQSPTGTVCSKRGSSFDRNSRLPKRALSITSVARTQRLFVKSSLGDLLVVSNSTPAVHFLWTGMVKTPLVFRSSNVPGTLLNATCGVHRACTRSRGRKS